MPSALAVDDDERAVLPQDPAEPTDRRGTRDVQHQVEPVGVRQVARRDVVDGVVEHLVGTGLAQQVEVAGAAGGGDVAAQRVGDLHREVPHPAGRAGDEHPVARPWRAVQVQALPRRHAGHRQGGGGHGVDAVGHGQQVLLAGQGQLGEGRPARAHDEVADAEPGHAGSHPLDRPREVRARLAPQPARVAPGQPHHRRDAGDDVPVGGVDAGRVHAHQHLALAGRRLRHVLEVEHPLGHPVAALHDRLHRRIPFVVLRRKFTT